LGHRFLPIFFRPVFAASLVAARIAFVSILGNRIRAGFSAIWLRLSALAACLPHGSPTMEGREQLALAKARMRTNKRAGYRQTQPAQQKRSRPTTSSGFKIAS
jgi:hypothetical protein